MLDGSEKKDLDDGKWEPVAFLGKGDKFMAWLVVFLYIVLYGVLAFLAIGYFLCPTLLNTVK